MLIPLRPWCLAGLAALGFAGFGVRELLMTSRTAPEPERISLHDLEQGARPSQPFVTIDAGYAYYESTAFEVKRERVRDAVYPLLSEQHPWMVAWDELESKYESLEDVPVGEVPALESVRVLGLSDRFGKARDIPDEGRLERDLVGVLFTYEELTTDEQELVDMIDGVDPRQVLVLEIGRRPTSVVAGVAFVTTGGMLGALAVWFLLRERRAAAEQIEREQRESDEFLASLERRGPPGGGATPPALPHERR